MKLQELVVAKRLYIDFLISASNECTKFVAKHPGVATNYNDVRVWFCAKATYATFKLFDVLHFVNMFPSQDISQSCLCMFVS